MKKLFIDTASSKITVAILDDKNIIDIYNEDNGHDLSSRIFPIIDSVLKKANVIPSELDIIYVVNGPGSFTGIRIGVTIAKTMAWALKKKIVVLSELELMATTDSDADLIVALIDARRKASFAGIYDKNGDIYLTDRYIKNDDLIKILPSDKKILYVSYDQYEEFNVVTPKIDIAKMIAKHVNDTPLNPHAVKPEYLKLTEAEENLQKENI